MRHPLAWTLLLCIGMSLVAACPRDRPPVEDTPDAGDSADGGFTGSPDGGTWDAGDAGGSVDAGIACSAEPSGGAPWRTQCWYPLVPDPCRQLELPDAGPVPSAEAWAEESSRIRCAAWVNAGTLDPSLESLCVETEGKAWAQQAADFDAGYRTYWPEAAWACLTADAGTYYGRPYAPACSCVFLRGETGAPCGSDTHCSEGYCLKDANDAGTCVQCPPRRPLGSTCGKTEQAPCDGDGYCSAGCCVPRPKLGESCGGSPYVPCGPDSAKCSDTCIESCHGGTCRPYRTEGETCGQAPYCAPAPPVLCDLGTCEQGLVCTYPDAGSNLYARCHSTGLHCNGINQGCGPDQVCAGPDRLCVPRGLLDPGEPCYLSAQCVEGLRCLTSDGGVAGQGSQGACAALPAGRCNTDNDCPWAQLCTAGQCTTSWALGAACTSPYDCAPYQVCAFQTDGGVCAPRPRIGERCAFVRPDTGTSMRYICAEGSCASDGYCR
jgi:hypothetical protein